VSVRPLQEGDLEGLFALRQLSFLDRSDFTDETVRARHRARLPYTVGHFLEGNLTSAAVCYPFEMFLAGRRVRVGGLAGVLSAPETRRRGFVRELLKSILERLYQNGVGWALEYPFDPRFYARYGFATVPTGCEVTVPAERLFRGAAPDAVRLTGGAEKLGAVYNAWAATYSLTLARDTSARPTWSRTLDGDRFCYVLEDAYAVMELKATDAAQTLVVHDYAFASPTGRERLWRFVGAFHGQADLISLHLPADEPLGFDLHRYHTNGLPALQARITDVQVALGLPVGSAEKTFCLRVHDPFCPWNDGVFRVALGPDGSAVTRTSETPDLSVQIGTLSQLVTGALSSAAAVRAGLAEGDAAVAEALASLSAGRATFMPSSDYF